jgi:fructoselysine-6-P-deglycase FrlB-like protein
VRFYDGIRAQPEALAASREAVAQVLDALPDLNSGTVALVGIGASAMAARSAALCWREAGISAFAVTAPELLVAGPTGIDVVVAISESGRSTETVEAVRDFTGIPSVGLTNDPASPLAGAVDLTVPLGCGEDSRAYTVGYTSTLQALGLIGDCWSARQADWRMLPELAAAMLDAGEAEAAAAAEGMRRCSAIDFVAGARDGASAGEGALLLREVARIFTSAHETRGYLHGPMEALEPGVVGCVVVGDGREVRLAGDTAHLGCHTLLVTSSPAASSAENLTIARVPQLAGLAATVLQVLPLQQLALALAEGRGLAPEVFLHHQDDTKLS